MKSTILDILTAVVIGLALCALALHGLDALFY
jgi:multisubunit Na+/H+ antiporter MnhC subunit